MDSITVKVIDLWAALNLMKKDGMKEVTLSLMEAEDDLPASIELEASGSSQNGFFPDECVSYDPVDAIAE